MYIVFENREKMVLVMEYAAGGELYDYLSERKVLTEDEARRIFRQIATAVYYCHKHKICHRDLKLENILLDENGSAKVCIQMLHTYVCNIMHSTYVMCCYSYFRLPTLVCLTYLMNDAFYQHSADLLCTPHRKLLKELHITVPKWTVGHSVFCFIL